MKAALEQKQKEEEDAKKFLRERKKVKESELEPEYVRMWSISPFATFSARPPGLNLFGAFPGYAWRMGDLSVHYLLEVSGFFTSPSLFYLIINLCVGSKMCIRVIAFDFLCTRK